MVQGLVVFSIVQKISVTSDFKWRAVFIMLTLCCPEDSISALNHFALNLLLLILPKDINVLTYKQQNNIPVTVVISSFCNDKMGSLWTFVLFVVSVDRVRHLATTCNYDIRLTFRETWLSRKGFFWERERERMQNKTLNRWIKF